MELVKISYLKDPRSDTASASLLSNVLKSHKWLWQIEEAQKLKGHLGREGWLSGTSWPRLCFKKPASWWLQSGGSDHPSLADNVTLQLKLAFATGQDETGEANTPSCPQEHGRDEHELSKLLNFSQNNGYREALDELFLPVSNKNCLGSNIIWLDRKLWSKTQQMALTQLFPVSYASLMKQWDLCQFSVWPEQTVQEGVFVC